MRTGILLALFAIVVVACAPVEQPIEAPTPDELPTLPEAEDTAEDEMNGHDNDPHEGMQGSEETFDPQDTTEVDVVFEVDSRNFVFLIDGEENPDMIVNQGDRVRVEFTSSSGVHDWVVDAFGATEIISAGGSSFVEFVADQAGTFEYYCSVGSHRQQGMRGNFIVQ